MDGKKNRKSVEQPPLGACIRGRINLLVGPYRTTADRPAAIGGVSAAAADPASGSWYFVASITDTALTSPGRGAAILEPIALKTCGESA